MLIEPDRVSRGGSWFNPTFVVRVAYRVEFAPGDRGTSGVRLSRLINPLQQLGELNNEEQRASR